MTWVTANVLVTSAVYLVATVLYMGYLLRFRDHWLRVGQSVLTLALALHGVAAIHIWAARATFAAPIAAQVAVFGSLVAAGVARWLAPRPRFAVLGAFVAPIVAVVLFSGWVGVHQERPVTPQVYAVITPVHIVSSVFGVVAFAVAFVASTLFVIRDVELRQRRLGGLLPALSVARLERVATRSIAVGFPLYTLGIVLGGVWAMRDGVTGVPAQYMFAVASWVVYGVLLHGRLRVGLRGRRAALFTMVGFAGAFAVAVFYAARATG